MNYDKTHKGHLAAFITILIWGTTFISTKVLLKTFSPVEILFIRFVMGYLALWLVCPRILRPDSRRQEPLFAAAGLCPAGFYDQRPVLESPRGNPRFLWRPAGSETAPDPLHRPAS